jgi:AhpC/TSA antioxidant enzyme
MDVRALEAAHVLDMSGRATRLRSLWSSAPAVVVWLRHFGCIYCAEQAREFAGARLEIEGLGARLAFVGNGSVAGARSFQARVAPGCAVFTDPRLESYQAIGARHGVLSTVGPQTWAHAVRAFKRGARQRRVQGHPFQQGGVLVVAPGTRVAYVHVSRSAGDHPPLSGVLEAVRGVDMTRTA